MENEEKKVGIATRKPGKAGRTKGMRWCGKAAADNMVKKRRYNRLQPGTANVKRRRVAGIEQGSGTAGLGGVGAVRAACCWRARRYNGEGVNHVTSRAVQRGSVHASKMRTNVVAKQVNHAEQDRIRQALE